MTVTQPYPSETTERVPRPSVVERVTQILDVFMLGEEFLMLEDVTAFTGLPRSTAFRILSQLTELNWLEHGPRGFSLGTRATGLASRTRNSYDEVRGAAGIALNDLHAATGAVAHLGVLEGARVHYLDKIGGAASGTVPSRVGGRFPADHTVCGKALLACLVPEKVDSLLTVSTAQRRRALDLPRLHTQLNSIRRQHGLAVDSAEHCSMGITAVAAPIIGPSGAVGAISLAGKQSLPLDRIAPMVVHAARRTAEALFPGWKQPRAGRGPAPVTALR
ncbi:IclR family transcriptional regulator [Nocardioides dubius]|uniref:IclR family transcriptional regulator n=1 Tax=Nocardioides dubius TaxID=317019 RepID=A0ABP4EGQ5_9ACTN